MALLREYTLGDKPVQVELISDPLEGKAEGFTYVLGPVFVRSRSKTTTDSQPLIMKTRI